MALSLSYPGVYVQELPSAVRAITGIATSIAAFVGRAWYGPVGDPIVIFSYPDYERKFGGLWADSSMSYAIQQFFLNGGSEAVVVRSTSNKTPPATATITLATGEVLVAANPGSWGMNLEVTIDYDTKDKLTANPDTKLFNLTVFDSDNPASQKDALKRGGSGAKETFLNVSVDPASPRFIAMVLEQQSNLLRVGKDAQGKWLLKDTRPAVVPLPNTTIPATPADGSGTDGGALEAADITGAGLSALDQTDIFNLLCLPPYDPAQDNDMAVWTAAATYCKKRRAVLLVDAPSSWTADSAIKSGAGGIDDFSAVQRDYAALYFPRVLAPDPLKENSLRDFVPCGAVAGVIARTDGARGVWKAPAGIEANLQGVMGFSIGPNITNLTDGQIGNLNQRGINCLRSMPVVGRVVWGTRTVEGADALSSQWKYLPIRRLALYIEESLFRGTQWVVFEPNDEPLWSQIRLDIGAFMQGLFLQGAFQGTSPSEAYFVKCSSETTTQADIDNGMVNIIVGFAPLKPAEFVVLKIQQIALRA